MLAVSDWLPECLDHGAPAQSGYCKRHGALLHRLIFQALNGYMPEVVMHSCDNPRCINPDHLRAGTWDLNNKDRARKGRSAKSAPSRRKITQEQAEAIRQRYAARIVPRDSINGIRAIARDYGIDRNVIYNIVEGKTHVRA